MAAYDDYSHNGDDDDRQLKTFLYVVGVIIFLALMWMMVAGCATGAPSSNKIDWNKVIAAIMEYRDDIPYDQIRDALNKIKK